MAIREARLNPTTIERIQRYRKRRSSSSPNRESLAAVRQVVRESDSVEAAIVAVRGIESAWQRASPVTRDAVGLMIAILELSDTVEDALLAFELLDNDGTLLKPLSEVRAFVQTEYPDARMRIVPGDDVSSAYLDIFIPAEDYSVFWSSYVHIRGWVIEHVPRLSRFIQPVPRPAKAAHV